ncbi:MAG: hypothetical protein AAB116_06035 [Candidatus Poribacteria bacterium]
MKLMQSEIDIIVEETIRTFCLEFLTHPYLCYTEHGLHALFYTRLYNALPPQQRYTVWNNQKLCVIQKEYPTAGLLDKPCRQHWDVAVIATHPQSMSNKQPTYDYLRLSAIIEFGLNEAKEHLQDDIMRVSHIEANTDKGYIVHLYRLSEPKLSGRDWSPKSARILSEKQVAELATSHPVTIYYGIWDASGKHETKLCRIDNNNCIDLIAKDKE